MIIIITHACISYAEVILHDGADACRVGGEPYMDNSRTSKVCKEHRKEYRKQQKKQRGDDQGYVAAHIDQLIDLGCGRMTVDMFSRP